MTKNSKSSGFQVENKDSKWVLLVNHRERKRDACGFVDVVGGAKQSLEGYEGWVAKGRGKNIPISRGNKQNTEMGTEKRHRNWYLLPEIFQYRARRFAHVSSFKVLSVLESGYQEIPLTDGGKE